MPRLIPAADELRRILSSSFASFGARADVEEIASCRWASITFSGERHLIRLRIDGAEAEAAADAFLDGLAEREFELRGHIVADVALVSDEREDGPVVRLGLEALTVEAG
jgi:hypothetical protein